MKKIEASSPDTRMAIIEKIEAIIQAKREPFEARQEHIRSLDVEVRQLAGVVDEYLANPRSSRLEKALSAEKDILAIQSLLPRISGLNVDLELSKVLDESREEFVPLLRELLAFNTSFLTECQECARQYRIAAASTSDYLLDIQARTYTAEVIEAQRTNNHAQRWLLEWSSGQIAKCWNFWSIYRAIKNPRVTLYAAPDELPVPGGFQRRRPQASESPSPSTAPNTGAVG